MGRRLWAPPAPRRGRLHVADTRDAARAELLKQYAAERAAAPERGQLVLAYRNDDVAPLNAGIRGQVTIAGLDYAAVRFVETAEAQLATARNASCDKDGQSARGITKSCG